MTVPPVPHPWLTPPARRSAMPAALQLRAARACRLVRADSSRPVPLSQLGYHLHPQGRYLLEIAASPHWEPPTAVTISGGSLRVPPQPAGSETTDDGRVLRYPVNWAWHEPATSPRPCCWSRWEEHQVRCEFADGREDSVHSLGTVIQPRWRWLPLAPSALLLLGALIPWESASQVLAEAIPAAWKTYLPPAALPVLWQLLAAALAATLATVYCLIWIGDHWRLGRAELRARTGLQQAIGPLLEKALGERAAEKAN